MYDMYDIVVSLPFFFFKFAFGQISLPRNHLPLHVSSNPNQVPTGWCGIADWHQGLKIFSASIIRAVALNTSIYIRRVCVYVRAHPPTYRTFRGIRVHVRRSKWSTTATTIERHGFSHQMSKREKEMSKTIFNRYIYLDRIEFTIKTTQPNRNRCILISASFPHISHDCILS